MSMSVTKTVMFKKNLRGHAAGHALKGGYHKVAGRKIMFERPCEYCEVSVDIGGCTLDIKMI